MLIPSIDLMGGKIVQLVQGEKKALEFDNFQYWIERFLDYPVVQVIDLDAAIGGGSNTSWCGVSASACPARSAADCGRSRRRCGPSRLAPRRSSSARLC